MRVLLIDDDPRVTIMLKRFLDRNDVEMIGAESGREGFEIAKTEHFDAIVLDLMMPGWNGFDTLRAIRDHGITTPVLFLTGSDSTDNLVKALEQGGDDFVEKPFEMRELLARVRAVARRSSPSTGSRTVEAGHLQIDTVSHRSTWKGELIPLTRTELRILHALTLARGEIVDRNGLREAGWGSTPEAGADSLGVHISNLRRRLADAGAGGLVQTVRGKGYRIDMAAAQS